jgi:hypothetical protein
MTLGAILDDDVTMAGNVLDCLGGKLLDIIVRAQEKTRGPREKFDTPCRGKVVSGLAINIIGFHKSLDTLKSFVFVLCDVAVCAKLEWLGWRIWVL